MLSLGEFSGLVADIYDAALDPTLWDETLKRIVTTAGGHAGSMGIVDQHRQPACIIASNLEPAQNRKYVEYYRRLDPTVPPIERSPVGMIVTARAIVTETQLREEFYCDFANRNEIGDAVFVNLWRSSDSGCTFFVGHPWRSEPFATPEVLRLVSLLAPHLQRAVQAQLGLGPLSQVRDGALDLVDRWRHGCVLVSLAGQVLYANRGANEIAAARDGLSLGCRGLCATVVPEDAALQRLIRQACNANGHEPRAGGRVAISRSSGRRPYAVQVLPLRRNRASFLNGLAAALVIIIDHEREDHLPPADLQELYDLTTAEAEVAIRVLKGHGLQSVANELRVSLSTVRVHLQRVFEKTGTHRQAELVRLLMKLETNSLLTACIGRRGFRAALLRPPPDDALQEWTVSPRVNRSDVGDDDPTLIEPT